MSHTLNCAFCRQQFTIDRWQPDRPVPCPACAGLLSVVDVGAQPKFDFGSHVLAAASVLVLLIGGQVALAVWWMQPKAASPRPPAALEVAVAEPAAVQPEPQAAERPAETVETPPAATPTAEPAPVIEPPAVAPVASKVRPAIAPPMPRFTSRAALSDEDLRKQLLQMPEVTVSVPQETPTRRVILMGKDVTEPSSDPSVQLGRFFLRQRLMGKSPHEAPKLLAEQASLRGLPFRMGDDCQLGKEPAETMQALARRMRTILAEASANNTDRLDGRINPEAVYYNVKSIVETHQEGAIPCLMQMLQPESKGVRLVMLNQVDSIKRRQATEALARIALYDLSDSIREKAIEALAQRPREEYRQLLLDGLRYPWPPVADHAAEALVELQDREAVPALERLVAAPNPAAPQFDTKRNEYVVPEVVRINHLSNCLLCHAVSSATTDLVRGRVPSPEQPLPPLTQYYEDTTGIFVRADATYLKQDFSVIQPVASPGRWPQMQRFDYLVRRRPLTASEVLQLRTEPPATSYPQREAVLLALKALKQ